MPHNAYLLSSEKDHILEVSWLGFVYDDAQMTVSVNKKVIGTIPDRNALIRGADFSLQDGSDIHIQLLEGEGLQVFEGGRLLDCYEKTLQALPEHFTLGPSQTKTQTDSDDIMIETLKEEQKKRWEKKSQQPMRIAYGILLFLGIAEIFFGLIIAFMSILLKDEKLQGFGYPAVNIIGGGIFFAFAILTKKGHFIPLIIAIVLYGLGSIFFFIGTLVTNPLLAFLTVGFRSILVIILVREAVHMRPLVNKKNDMTS